MNISSYPERELIKIASEFKKHLKNKFPKMKSSSSGIDQGFIYKFKALFYEVQAHPWESEGDSISNKYNLELEALGDQIRNFFPLFRFYLQKAFPYNSDLCEKYGYVQLEMVIHNYDELREFLDSTVNLINDKRFSLKAANCPDCMLDEIINLSAQIKEVHEDYLNYVQKKQIHNQAYQNNMKELFKLMEIVHEAASNNLQDDPESLRHLTFPPKEYIQ